MGAARAWICRALRGISETAALDADLLLQHCLDRGRAWLLSHPLAPISTKERDCLRASIRRRAAGEPVAYITGTRGFWTLDLRVTAATLIPRPETEVLVEHALARIPADRPRRVADLGTGCGAVALALARERPQARVVATDVSADALDVARNNRRQCGMHNVEFRRGDWFSAVESQRFHLVVANPPYVALGDPSLSRDGVCFEPPLALLAGAGGLDALEVVINGAPRHLHTDGWLLVEHGCDQGAAVRRLMRESTGRSVATFRDYAGLERVSACRFGA